MTLPQFDLTELRTFFVDVYEHQWAEVEKLIGNIKAGRPITI